MNSNKKSIKVFAPASSANLNCGFDILGFALKSIGDEIILQLGRKKGLRIKKITGDNGILPLDVEKNTASVAINSLLKHKNIKCGLDLTIHKKMPLESGLGSSAASSVAAIYALNILLDLNLSKFELIRYAMDGEFIASGTHHADNIAPSMLGGITLIRDARIPDVVQLPTPKNLFYSIIHPKLGINTKSARGILKNYVSLKDCVTQSANVGGLVCGLCTDNYELISRSLTDVIVEPSRMALIPNFKQIRDSALFSGALGFGISGSGPSLFALADNEDTAMIVAEAMQKEFEKINISSTTYVGIINHSGVMVVA